MRSCSNDHQYSERNILFYHVRIIALLLVLINPTTHIQLVSSLSKPSSCLSRRSALSTITKDSVRNSIVSLLGISSGVFVGVVPLKLPAYTASAATVSDTTELDSSKQKIVKGFRRLTFLLDNWVTETTVCGRGDNPYVTGKGCVRDPMKVMEYLGYRDINDPLFRADKTMKKLEPIIPAGRFGEYLDAIEKWSEAAEEGNGMAYISSWGEANPGGGKDRVELFIERARKNVIDSRDSLATIIDILDLPK